MLRRYVEDKLNTCWSPMQISRRLLVDHTEDESMRVSQETILDQLLRPD